MPGFDSSLPFFSICVPQFNRTAFLIEGFRSLLAQDFRDFEICISDDCSTDGLESELVSFLSQSGLSFKYQRQDRNLRYDGNLRAAIALSRGKYCLLMGNDDCLASCTTLREIHDEIERAEGVGVAITNYEEFASTRQFRRMIRTGLIGSGPDCAADNFRNLSFVSGVILNGKEARLLASDKWDGSEMYQVYIACRIVAKGYPLLGIDRVAVRKDIQLPGLEVDSYAKQPRLDPCPITERRHTFDRLGRLVVDALEPFVGKAERQRIAERILGQLLIFTYPFWLIEFRRIQSWNYAAGICLGMRPRNLMKNLKLSHYRRLRIRMVYLLISLIGLLFPIRFFDRLCSRFHSFAKSTAARKLTTALSR